MKEKSSSCQSVSKWCVASMAAVPLMMTLGNSMLIPVLPILEKKLDISSFKSSLVITGYSIASIILIPIAGYLSDRWGRKMILLPCLVISCIGGLISGWASWKVNDPYMSIMVGRVIQGVGAAGAFPIILPLVGDLYSNDDEASECLGMIETANTSGKVLSPILGAALASFIWFLPFFSISILSIITFLMILFFVKVSKKKEKPKTVSEFATGVKKIFKTDGKWLLTVFIVGSFIMLILFSIQFYLSEILESEYDIHKIKKGFVLAIPLFFLCVTSYFTGKKIKDNKKLMKIIIIFSLIVMAATVSFASKIDNLYFLLALLSGLGIAIGTSLPALDALLTENVEKEQRGTITSFYSSARFFGVAAGPPLTSYFMKHNETWLFFGFGITALLLFILVMKWIKVEDKSPTTSGSQAG